MSALSDYIRRKGEAVGAFLARILAGDYAPSTLKARVAVEGRSGVRRIRLREHQVLSDSPPELLGLDLGPSSPELVLGALGSCLAHSWLIQAARLGVPLDHIEVTVEGQLDHRAGEAGHEATLREPHGITYTVHVESEVGNDDLRRVQEAVDRLCPILNLLRNPQSIHGRFWRPPPALETYP